jgi:hypothetical protein
MKRAAICLRGAMSKIKSGHFSADLYTDKPYVDYKPVKVGLNKHLIKNNPDYEFDFFIHCWNEDLETDLVNLYNPVSHKFESQTPYKHIIEKNLCETYGKTAQRLSISKVIELYRNHDKCYNKVIICRPDVLLYNDLDLSLYDKTIEGSVYVNSNVWEDFHFILSHNNTLKFGGVIDYKMSIPNYIKYLMEEELIADDIKCGYHQEVIRKIKSTCIDKLDYSPDFFKPYGLDVEYINQLTHN